MKEAPEKVYLALNVFGDIIKDQWQFHRLHDDDIEYTRIDVFIKKALKWMISQGGVNDALSREMIEDFKEAMKL